METCLFLMQAKLPEHNSMLTRWFRRRILGTGHISSGCVAMAACGGYRAVSAGSSWCRWSCHAPTPHTGFGVDSSSIFSTSTARNARRTSPSALARISSMADSKGSLFINQQPRNRAGVPFVPEFPLHGLGASAVRARGFNHRCVFGTASRSRCSKRPRE